MHKHVTHGEDSWKGIGGDNWLELIQDEDTGAASRKDQTKESQRIIMIIVTATMCSNKLPSPAVTQLSIHFRQLIIINNTLGWGISTIKCNAIWLLGAVTPLCESVQMRWVFGEFRLSGNRKRRPRCVAASALMQGYSYSAPGVRRRAGKNILLVSWWRFTVEYLT